MKQIKRITLIAVLLITTLLQGQTKVFNSQVRIKQVPLSSSLDSLVTINSDGLLTYLAKSDLASGGALEFITEGGNTGIAIKGRNPANYGDIGEGAIDLSFSNSASTAKGATGNYSLAVGLNNTAGLNSLVSGAGNTAGLNSLVSGSSNVADQNSISGGLSNVSLRYSLVSGRENTVGNAGFGAGREVFAPSYAESALGMYGTDYVPANTDAYNSNDRLFSLANGQGTNLRNDALIVYKNGNAILDGELTADKFIGDGSSLTNVDAATLDGYNKDDFVNELTNLKTDASIEWGNKSGLAFFANSTGSTNYPSVVGYGVNFETSFGVNSSNYNRSFTLWKWSGQERLFFRGFDSNGDSNGFKEIYHEGNLTPAIIDDVLKLTPRAQPGSPVKGMVYYDSGTDLIRYYNGTIWVTL